MTATVTPSRARDAELAAAIDGTLASDGVGGVVVRLTRRPFEYATSAPLELVVAELSSGARLELVLKYFGGWAASNEATRAKPAFVVEPTREIEMYRRLLTAYRVGPRCYGWSSVANDHWLLTARVAGVEMYQVGEPSAWCVVARWLAALHERLGRADVEGLRAGARLIVYDRAWYEGWMHRALQYFADDDPPRSRYDRTALRWLAQRYDRVVDYLLTIPTAVVHGEFCASNVLISEAEGDTQVVPVDWEMAAIGPGVIDLAALTLGDWREDDRSRVLASYADACGARREDLTAAVQYAQIHLAVQWLGWFGRRRQPAEHARDWLADAIERAHALDFR